MGKLIRCDYDDTGNITSVTINNNGQDVRFEPVKCGKWEGIWNGGWRKPQMHCSICKKTIKYTDGFLKGFPNYCPGCGAKMDLED